MTDETYVVEVDGESWRAEAQCTPLDTRDALLVLLKGPAGERVFFRVEITVRTRLGPSGWYRERLDGWREGVKGMWRNAIRWSRGKEAGAEYLAPGGEVLVTVGLGAQEPWPARYLPIPPGPNEPFLGPPSIPRPGASYEVVEAVVHP